MEVRFSNDLLVTDRTIEGVVVRYGDIANLPFGRERIEAGAFDISPNLMLNLQHSRERPLARNGYGLSLVDSTQSLTMRADLPDTPNGNETLTLIDTHALSGISAEFLVSSETRIDGVRVIRKAKLCGISIVDTPAYPDSSVDKAKRWRVWL